MAISDLYSKDSPYVHSNIYHFIDSVEDYFGSFNDNEARADLDRTIDNFNKWIGTLQKYEQELYTFFGVSDYQGLNTKLFGYEANIFSKIAQSVILQSNMIRKLIPTINKEQAEQIFKAVNNVGFDSLFQNMENELPLNTVREQLFNSLKDFLRPATDGKTITKSTALTQLGPELSKALADDFKDWTKEAKLDATSKTSKLHQLSDAILKQAMGDFNISKSDFMSAFMPEYLQALREAQIPISSEKNLHNIAQDYALKMYNAMFANHKFTDRSSIIGRRGEGMIKYSMDTSDTRQGAEFNLKVEILDIGNKSEAEIQQELISISKNLEMTNYSIKGENNFSQTDIIIKVETDHGTKLFRVQSKDSLLSQLEKTDKSKSVSPMTIHMKSGSISKILNMLLEKTIMTQEETNMLGYYIANTIWFHERGTYSSATDSSEKRTRGIGGGLAGAQAIINQIVSRGIQAFIGITINEANEDAPLNLMATNIFYFLGARALFPVSEVLKAAVTQMENLKTELMRIHFRIDMGTADFKYDKVKEFWEKKLNKVGTFTSGYNSGELLGIGKSQGAAIMGSVSGAINFVFDIEKVLRLSSYLF